MAYPLVIGCKSLGNATGGSGSFLLDTGEPLTTEAAVTSTRPLDNGDSFRLGYGYDRLSGERRPSCLDKTKIKLVGRNIRTTSSRFVIINTKEDLAKTLNIEVNAEASGSYGSITGSASTKVSILKTSTFNSRSIMGLQLFTHSAQTLEVESPYQVLTEEMVTKLETDNRDFRLRCGDAYTKSATTGAAMYITVNLESKSNEFTNNVTTQNSVKAAFSNLASASSSTAVTKETKQTLSQFTISLNCGSVGVGAQACAEPLLAVNADDLNAVIDFMNRAKKALSESISSNPNMMVAIDEQFEDYPKPEDMLDRKTFEVFYDYSDQLKMVKTLLDRESTVNALCNIQMHPSCQDVRTALASQVKYCARQALWADCDIAKSDISDIINAANQAGVGAVTLYEHGKAGGKRLTLDFTKMALNPQALQLGVIYKLSDFGFAGIASEYFAMIKKGYQLRMFEKADGSGRCFMISSDDVYNQFRWFNDKSQAFRLERVGDYPMICN